MCIRLYWSPTKAEREAIQNAILTSAGNGKACYKFGDMFIVCFGDYKAIAVHGKIRIKAEMRGTNLCLQ